MESPQSESIQVVLVDDEFQSRKTLRIFLQDYCPQIEVVGEADGVLEGYKLLLKTKPDAVFLDVQMNDGTGFDLLNKFPNPSFQVIFTTAFDEFAIKAFRYSAVDYLLKPIDIDDLIKAVARIKRSNKESGFGAQLTNLVETNKTGKFDKIALSSSDGLHFLELENIIRLESEANYTTFHLVRGKRITIAKTLKNFEELLPKEEFFRPHQSHLINLNYVEKTLREDGGYLMMKDDCKVPISRSKKELFMNLIKDRFIQ